MKRHWWISRWLKRLFASAKPVPKKRRRSLRLNLERLEERWLPSTFTVTDTSDSATDTGSLRYALSNLQAGGNTISFAIGSQGSTQTISLGSALPPIAEPVAILGYTQGGASYSGPPLIVINGQHVNPGSGLDLEAGSSGSEVQGLVIQDVTGGGGILINGTSGNLITGNFIGTNATGTGLALPRNEGNGITLENGASANTIGGTASGAGNVLSGNESYGLDIQGSGNLVLGNFIGTNFNGTALLVNDFAVVISAAGNTVGGGTTGAGNVIVGGLYLVGAGASGNLVLGNRIDTNAAGTAALRSLNRVGVALESGANANTIGGAVAGDANVISGGYNDGVYLYGGGTSANLVIGNFIGTDINGAANLGNYTNGVLIQSGATDNTIGGAGGDGNVISGYSNSTSSGVEITGAGTSGNLVLGNKIGTDVNGTAALPNFIGVLVQNGATANTLGGTASGAFNVISGNTVEVYLRGAGTSGNVVLGNYIGTDVNGTASFSNNEFGMIIDGATANTIGGTASGAANVISGNGAYNGGGTTSFLSEISRGGLILYGGGTTGNVVLGNLIGTQANGTVALGNKFNGVALFKGAADNTIGGAVNGAGNVISASNFAGVYVYGASTSGNLVLGNLIGTDVHGTAGLGNAAGIFIYEGGNNTIGGVASGAGNVVSGNNLDGIGIDGASGNLVLGNLIGTDINGTAALGNASEGVVIGFAPANTIGGTAAGDGNIISGNAFGLVLSGAGTSGNVVLGNFIGTDKNGTASLGNADDGVFINGGATAIKIGGAATGAGNVISANGANGIEISGSGTSANLVFGNYIGTDKNGTASLGNTGDGVFINGDATANTIGGAATGAGNVISGNGASGSQNGVEIAGSGTSGNLVFGNFIGTDKNGTASLGNTKYGVNIDSGATANTIGGTASGAANIISGNSQIGVYLYGGGTSGNLVLGNLIGTDKNGTANLGNSGDGVGIGTSATANTVGGTAAGAGNLISGNSVGVNIGNTASGNIVLGNLIGTDIHGTAQFGNTGVGVRFFGANGNTVGGTAAGAANVISGNLLGVELAEGSGNVVLGNLIGTDVNGTAALGNSDGVEIEAGAASNTVGGGTSGAGNVISGNGLNGVYITDAGTSGNVVLGNFIGTDVNGTANLGNTGDGVLIENGATANTVGGAASGAGNVISGNSTVGVQLSGIGTSGNIVLGNFIGADVHGTAAVGNSVGVLINMAATANTVGGTATGAGNVISGNSDDGVLVKATTANLVLGNLIGTDVNGTAGLGNSNGVVIWNGAQANTIGGTATGAANVISGNTSDGVSLYFFGTSGNVVLGNLIGTDIHGTTSLANSDDGVLITNSASGNTIGGSSGAGNVISGNLKAGVEFGVAVASNTVSFNLIGTNVTQTAALGNAVGLEFSESNDTIGPGSPADPAVNTIAGNTTALQLAGNSNLLEGLQVGPAAYALGLPNGTGVLISGSGNTVGGTTSGTRNVISGNSGHGVSITGPSNLLEGNFIGTDGNGAVALANGGDGVAISSASNTIGGSAAGAGNVISGNTGTGMDLDGAGASGNVVLGNFIGTDGNGTARLGNGFEGIFIGPGATDNTIGGVAANVISGNSVDGVEIESFDTTAGNLVVGNLIGTDKNGTAALGNAYAGVYVYSSGNTIGGTSSGAGNVISGNNGYGVYISGTGNVVLGNLIGTDKSGTTALGNSIDGVALAYGSTANTVGGTSSSAGNVISGNTADGVLITNQYGYGTSANLVEGNFIGTDETGTVAVGNGAGGVLITDGTVGNTIGAGNVVSGNGANGVEINGSGTSGNLVRGNLIGADITGTAKLGNTQDGVLIDNGATGNTIDGAVAAPTANVISGNAANGVEINGSGTSGNVVLGNLIGTDINGAAPLGNGFEGVNIFGGATSNTVGGSVLGAANVISANDFYGVYLRETGTSGNVVLGNLIGTDKNGTAPLGNTDEGVVIRNGATANTVGGTMSGAANIISANGKDGVYLLGDGTSGNVVLGNLIGTDKSGAANLGNSRAGVLITQATANTVGGSASGAANVISANGKGVYLYGSPTTGNVVLGNLIGTDITGTVKLGNSGAGVEIKHARGNTVGGSALGAANVISANSIGVYMVSSASGNLVLGNLIGTDINGTAELGNTNDGVLISGGATANTIDGGVAAPTANVISGNGNNGVEISGNGTSGNLVFGNLIGADKSGTANVGNTNDGVVIQNGAMANTVGGTASAAANVISGNGANGVEINGSGTSGNVVFGNLIGADKNGTANLGNTGDGVSINSGATANTLGGTASGAANVISGNGVNGVYLTGSGTSANVVLGNRIGADSHGTANLGNSNSGVVVTSGAAANTVGGTVSGSGNVISANADDGIYLGNAGTSRNLVLGNLIGTDVNGTAPLGNSKAGVYISSYATANTIGGTTAGSVNVISANGGDGVSIYSSSDNVLLGNFIGADVHGTAKLANGGDGVQLLNGATGNTIGGATSGSGNVISGNSQNGVYLFNISTSGNLVLGNRIGADIHGTAAIGNTNDGVEIFNAEANTIGGTAAGDGNVISGNSQNGVYLAFGGASANVVLGNLIGADQNGDADLGNAGDGILIFGNGGLLLTSGFPTANTVGGAASGAANVISGNGDNGVEIAGSGASANLVIGNFIGADVNGTAKLGNGANGVLIDGGAPANTIGGTASGAGNVISGNANGVYLTGSGTSGNLVLGNLIGADVNGTASLGNSNDGVFINSGATANTIGGTAAGAGNVISGNSHYGVQLFGTGTSGNVVLGNLIGTDVHGTAKLGNLFAGVDITYPATSNTIGGSATGAGNVISGNGSTGLFIQAAGGNVVLGNKIGTDVTGAVPLGNSTGGVDIYSYSDANTVGGATTGDANVISANGTYGIYFSEGSSGNVVLGNLIGTDVHGTANLGNTGVGVLFGSAAVLNTIGGTAGGDGNVIAFNSAGVVFNSSTAVQDSILGNSVFSNTGLGIDLGSPAGNNGQPSPVLTVVDVTPSSTTVEGTLTSSPGTYRLEFFASPSGGPAGQGQTFLGFDNVTVPGGGSTSFTATGLAVLPANSIVTATATNTTAGSTYGDTSAFSAGELPSTGNFVVTDTSDSATDPHSLRYALTNANKSGDSITFDIPGAGVQIINPGSALPSMAAGVVLNGFTQGDAGYSGPPLIEIDGVSAGAGVSGLTLSGSDTVEGLIVGGFNHDGISVNGSGNLIVGDYIGTNAAGTAALGNAVGVFINAGATHNTIGGTASGAGNVISGNSGDGVEIAGVGASGNVVLGNLIGTDSNGTAKLGNRGDGVLIEASKNTIGGTATGAGNVISGNGTPVPSAIGPVFSNGNGVEINGSSGLASGNLVEGNFIGTTKTGTVRLGNVFDGVLIAAVTPSPVAAAGATSNTIGGIVVGAVNVISGNAIGVQIDGAGASGNLVLGDKIGTNKAGTLNLGNAVAGISLLGGASHNSVGGAVAGDGNSIAFNAQGVVLNGATTVDDTILGNSIFANTGLGINLGSPAGNHGQKAPATTSVSATSYCAILISPNGTYQVEVFASPASGPAFQGKTFLGAIDVVITNGSKSFMLTGLAIPAGSYVTSTATNLATGDTSAFSTIATATAVTSSPTIKECGAKQTIQLTAQVSSAQTVAVGTVTFTIVGIGSVTVAVGPTGEAIANFVVPAGTAGSYKIIAVYNGSEEFAPSTSIPEADGVLTVKKK